MKNIRYIDKKDVENLIENKISDDVIIFSFGPYIAKNTFVSITNKGYYCCQWFCAISVK